jgi:sulfite reductase (NADPH) flavoprotein alpha-component
MPAPGVFWYDRPTLSQPTTSPVTQRHPFAAVRTGGHRLTPPGAPKDTQHHVISIAGSGIVYRPGDALGVWPSNHEPLVDAILRRLNANGGEPVAVGATATTLREALLTRFELTNVSRRLLEACATQGSELCARLLEKGHEDQLKGYLQARDNIHDVLDVLNDAPVAAFAPQEFVTLLRPMQPRLYSIASSLSAHPDEVHLLVVTLSYMARGRLRLGVGSTFLNERWPLGATAPIYTQDAQKHFGMPADHGTPMIMIGPGTGLAPFRAFMEEREAAGATGRNWLFFGDQSRAWAFYYEPELTAWEQRGLLRLDLAFSRDQPHKIYVQHRMGEHARDLYAWLEEGAEVFICGDKERMATDVQAALVDIVRDEGGRTPEQAAEYVNSMRKTKRLKLDVY